MRTKNPQIQGKRKTFGMNQILWKKLAYLKLDKDFETWDELVEDMYEKYIKERRDENE